MINYTKIYTDMAFDNTEQIENKQKPSYLNSANIETKDEGTKSTMKVNRLNLKYNALYKILLCSLPETLTFFNGHDSSEETKNRYNQYIQTCQEIDNLDTGCYTAPHYGINALQANNQTLSAVFKENHILGSLNTIVYGQMASDGVEIPDEYKTKGIVFEESEIMEVVGEDENVRKKYSINKALDQIKEQIASLYPDDNLVTEVLNVIRDNNVSGMKNLMKIMIAIITEETKVTEQKIGNTKFVVTRSSYNFGDNSLRSEKKENTKEVSIENCIEFDRSNIKTQQVYKNVSNDIESVKGAVVKSRMLNYVLIGSKRYYINKDTGYIYETPDKNIELLTYNDNVRIYNGKKWFDRGYNAVLARDNIYSGRKQSSGTSIVFSFFDPDKGSYIYSSPFQPKIMEANIKDPEKGNDIPGSDDKNIHNRYTNIVLDDMITALKKKDDYWYEKDQEFFKDHGVEINPDNDPLVLDNFNDITESLERTRAHGYKNILSVTVSSSQRIFSDAYKASAVNDAEHDTISNLLASSFVCLESLNSDVAKQRKLAQKISKWCYSFKPNRITTITYKNGVETERQEPNIVNFSCNEVFTTCGTIVDQNGVANNTSDYLTSITEEPNEDFCLRIFNEDFEHKKYGVDLASIAYNKKDFIKQQEEYFKNRRENINDKKRKRAQLKQKEENMKNIEKEYNENAVNETKKAVSRMNRIEKSGFFAKFWSFICNAIGIRGFKTEDEIKFNNVINTIKSVSESAVFSKKDVSEIQSIISSNKERLDIKTTVPEITFNVSTNLSDARKNNKKKI